MNGPEDLARLNSFLGTHGLPTLDEPHALVEALAFLIETDAEFRSALNKCKPELRHEMYQALAPRLRFTPKPLDVYIAELGMDAEARKLPTIKPDGTLEEFKVPEVNTDES